jgi:hypothetical protein
LAQLLSNDLPTLLIALFSLLVAAYAAILSTVNFIVQRRDKMGRVEVTINAGIVGLAPGVASDADLLLEAKNAAHRTVVLTMPGLILPDGREMFFLYPQSHVSFPHEFKPEYACSIWTDMKKLARQLRSEGFSGTIKLIGFYKDAVGRKHKIRPYKLNLDNWP